MVEAKMMEEMKGMEEMVVEEIIMGMVEATRSTYLLLYLADIQTYESKSSFAALLL
jgi:hypothetical protein